MIGYVTLGTNQFEKACEFYDKLLAEIGAGRYMENDSFVAWAVAPGQPAFSVTKPFNKEPATVGNGVMIALAMKNQEQVDKLYAKALELGGTCEGPAGPRGDSFYAGYFRDLDGNKLNAFCIPQKG